MRISFTDQRLTAYGGMVGWSQFLHQSAFRTQLDRVLPHRPTSNHAYDLSDTALGFIGGIIVRTDKLSRSFETISRNQRKQIVHQSAGEA